MTNDNDTPSHTPTTDQQTLIDRLITLDDQLHQLLESHYFYHTAMIALARLHEDEDVERWAMGAIFTKDHLHHRAEALLSRFGQLRGEIMHSRETP